MWRRPGLSRVSAMMRLGSPRCAVLPPAGRATRRYGGDRRLRTPAPSCCCGKPAFSCGLTNPRACGALPRPWAFWRRRLADASVIARFAIAKGLKPTSPPTPIQQRLNALVARLRQVTDDLTVCKQRRSSAMSAEMIASIDEVIALLKRQARTLQGEIASLIDDDPLWSRLEAAMRTVKGVADRTVARMLAELPEIGIYSNKAVVKLAGLRRSPTIAAPGPARGTSAVAAPASAPFSSWSQISRAVTTQASRTFIEGSPPQGRRKWLSASQSPANSSLT